MDRGHVHLFRKVWNNPVLHERGKRFSRLEAWLWIISILARGTDDSEMRLKRGEFQASIRYLGKSWKWSRGAVERFLSDLQQGSDPMITRLGHLAGHLAGQLEGHFKICKYETYNKIWDTSRDTSRDKVNKDKRKNKEGEIKDTSQADAATMDQTPSESYRLSEKLREAIAFRDPRCTAIKLPGKTKQWAKDIDKLLRIDGRTAEECESVIAWCQSPGCFWGPNIMSGRRLREKFDTLWGQMQNRKGGLSEPETAEELRRKSHEQAERIRKSGLI